MGIAALAAAALFFAAAGPALAHGPESVMSERGYEQMRRLAHDLDGQARHANDQAQHQQYWEYQRDRNFLRAVANFSRRAAQFHARIDTYRTQPWQVDDELRLLLRDARAVQFRLQRSRHADEHTVDDWNATVSLLNRMIRLYEADIQGRQYGTPDSPDAYSSDVYSGSGSGRSDRYGAPAERMDRRDDRYGSPAQRMDRSSDDEVGALSHDLAQRSARLAETARQLAGPFPLDANQRTAWQLISDFAQQSRAIDESIGRQPGTQPLRGNMERLAQAARAVEDQMRRTNAFPEIRQEWNQAMQVLARLRAAAGA
jgi:hypothetical protein